MDPIDVDYEVVCPAPRKAAEPKRWSDAVFYTLEAWAWLMLVCIALYGIDKLLERIVIG